MTESKHTPGPLFVDCAVDGYGNYTIRLDDATEHGNTDEDVIATAYKVDDAERLVACWNSHDDLLEALETLSSWPRKSETANGALSSDPTEGIANMRRFARAAIAKARIGTS